MFQNLVKSGLLNPQLQEEEDHHKILFEKDLVQSQLQEKEQSLSLSIYSSHMKSRPRYYSIQMKKGLWFTPNGIISLKMKLNTRFKDVDMAELNAFIGALILRKVFGRRNESITNLWAESEFSRLVFTASMSRRRFSELLRLTRFDDRARRAARKYNDNFTNKRGVRHVQ